MKKARTVTGDIPAQEMGFTYPHEHLHAVPPPQQKDRDLEVSDYEKSVGELLKFKSVGGCTLVEASGNGVLLETYSRVQGRFLVANYLIRPPRTRNLSGTVAGHDAILSAIRSGDASAAAASLHEHIVGVLNVLSM